MTFAVCFQKSRDTVRVSDEKLSLQVKAMGTYLDRDFTKCLGGLAPVGRPEAHEVKVASFAMEDDRSGSPASPRNSSISVEIFQKDLIAFERSDDSTTVTFLLNCCVESSDKVPSLLGATIRLYTGAKEGFLAADVPPGDAEYAGAAEEGGQIVFNKSTANKGIYVGFETSGVVRCSREGGRAIQLDIDASTSEDGVTKKLSGLLLLCVSLPLELALEIRLTAKVRVAARSSNSTSVMGKLQQMGKEKELNIKDKTIKLPLMP